MQWLRLGYPAADEREQDEQARLRLIDQERRVQAIDRMVEVIQRQISEDQAHAAQ